MDLLKAKEGSTAPSFAPGDESAAPSGQAPPAAVEGTSLRQKQANHAGSFLRKGQGAADF